MSDRKPLETAPYPARAPEEQTVVQRGGAPLTATPRPVGELPKPTAARIGEYETQKQLGAGGMGIVYQGWDTQLRRNVAIKVLLREYSADAEARERFLREARAAASITHDNVVGIYHVGDHHGSAYLVMPLLKGLTLEAFLLKKGTPTVPQVLRIAREIAAGLAAAHKQGLIHRDVKPANIWLESPNGRVKILDFGIAKPVNKGQRSTLTEAGVVMGTPAFMSPEQARGHTVDSRSDLYSLGAVMYRMCTGQAPFVRPTVMDTLTALVSEDPTPVREMNSAVPPSLANLIHRLLQREPKNRPESGEAVIKELRQIERELSTERVPTGVIGVQQAVRITAEAIPVVQPEEPGFEVVDDVTEPVTSRYRKKKKRRATGIPTWPIVVGTACVVGVVIVAIVVNGMVRTVKPTEKPEEKAVPVVKTEPPAAKVEPVVQPELEKPEVRPEDPFPPPPGFRPPMFDPEGRPLPPPPRGPRPPFGKGPPPPSRERP